MGKDWCKPGGIVGTVNNYRSCSILVVPGAKKKKEHVTKSNARRARVLPRATCVHTRGRARRSSSGKLTTLSGAPPHLYHARASLKFPSASCMFPRFVIASV